MATKTNQNNKTNKNSVGLKELRSNMEEYIARVDKGETITVMRRSKPLFKLTPVDEEDEWETVVDFTKEFGAGVPVSELLTSMKKTHGSK